MGGGAYALTGIVTAAKMEPGRYIAGTLGRRTTRKPECATLAPMRFDDAGSMIIQNMRFQCETPKRRGNMKKSFLAALIVTLLVAPVWSAEKSIGLTLAQIEADRKAIIGEMVAPTEQQTEQFWETYWTYRGGVKMLTDRTLEVVEEFAAAEGALSGSRSAALVLEVMNIEKRRAALKQTYVKRFQGVLTPSQVVRWYQTERKMDAVIRAQMAAAIPFNDLASRSGAGPTHTELRSGREALALEIVQPMENQKSSFLYVYRVYKNKTDKLDDRI